MRFLTKCSLACSLLKGWVGISIFHAAVKCLQDSASERAGFNSLLSLQTFKPLASPSMVSPTNLSHWLHMLLLLIVTHSRESNPKSNGAVRVSKRQHDVHVGWGFMHSHQTDRIQISKETVLTTKTFKISPVMIQKKQNECCLSSGRKTTVVKRASAQDACSTNCSTVQRYLI